MSIWQTVYEEFSGLISFFITILVLQNVVLTTGFGAPLMLSVVRRPKNIWLFSAVLTVFSVLTVTVMFLPDKWLGTEVTNWMRPVILMAVVSVIYLIITPLIRYKIPRLYSRIGKMLPMVAYNDLIVGIALSANTHFSANLGSVIGLAIGSCLSFALLTWITAEGIERLDNPDMPPAFRGLPATLIYTGLVALALLGFTSDVSLL